MPKFRLRPIVVDGWQWQGSAHDPKTDPLLPAELKGPHKMLIEREGAVQGGFMLNTGYRNVRRMQPLDWVFVYPSGAIEVRAPQMVKRVYEPMPDLDVVVSIDKSKPAGPSKAKRRPRGRILGGGSISPKDPPKPV